MEAQKALPDRKILAAAAAIAAVILYLSITGFSTHDFSEQDVQFMQRMSVHHDQAIKMSRWAPSRTNNTQLLELAENISTVQGREHRKMENWLHQSGHNVHPRIEEEMAGMATEQEMQRLRNSTGTQFNQLYLKLMIKHHIGGVQMAEKQVRNGESEKLIEMARKMIKAQKGEIELMRDWQRQRNQSS